MRKLWARVKAERDFGPALCVALGLVLVAAKLVLARSQQVFLWPEEARLDDMVMYDAAVSIAKGQWLGPYGYTTLAKNSFFALWLAGVHSLGVPFLQAGQALWAGASLAGAAAFAPALKRRWLCLLLFAALLFSPASLANPAALGDTFPVGFVSRVYRDNIFPALCLLAAAGMVGYALRCAGPLRRGAGWLAGAGLALAAAWLCREDGWWMLPFALGAAGVTLWAIVRDEGMNAGQKRRRALCLLLPFALLSAGLLAWCAANYHAYGRFVLNDFSTGEFADAYGAMTRVEHENWNPKTDVPRDVRQKLYAQVPAFAELRALLEGEGYLSRYAGKAEGADYSSGAFYWALREAAAERGYYDTPQKAAAYFAHLADAIHALCDDGTLPAFTGRRTSVNPPLRAAYVGPVVREGLYGLWFCATFRQCEPYSLFSPHSNDAGFYADTIAPMEDFLYEKALTATRENSDAPYYSPWQRLCYGVLDAVRAVYAVLTPCALALGLCWQVWQGAALLGALRKKRRAGRQGLLWAAMLGLLLCVLLRCFMVAFVTVSSFRIGTFVMYLASVHPLLLIYAVVGTVGFVRLARGRRRAERGAV